MDNTVFFVGPNASPTGVRDQLAEVCELDPRTILLAPAIGYDWHPADYYRGKTLLQWHRYDDGDFTIEFEVLLGGSRLGVGPTQATSLFQQLALRLEAPILSAPEDAGFVVVDAGGEVKSVRVQMPDEYGATGPVLRP